MFNFGIFTSHIPYIVFIAVYIIYLLTHTINKLNDNATSSIPDKKANCIVLHTGEFHESYITAQNVQYDDIDLFISAVNQTGIPEEIILFRFIIPPEDIPVHKLFYSLFSRPPPFIA